MHVTIEILEELATLDQINSLSVVLMFLFIDRLFFFFFKLILLVTFCSS